MRLASNAPTATSKCAVRGPVAKFGVKRLGLEGVRRHRKRDETKNTIAHESSRDFGGEQCSTSRRVERQFRRAMPTPKRRASASPKRGQRTSHTSGLGPRTVFVTVGTTQFDELTTTLLSDEVLSTLAAQGYTRLVMQLGRGTEPSLPSSPPLQIDWCAIFRDMLILRLVLQPASDAP